MLRTYVLWLQVTMSIILTGTISTLTVMLKGRVAFTRERNLMLIIMFYFDLTYLLRATIDYLLSRSVQPFGFSYCMYLLCLPIFCDLLPIGLIVLIHYLNFNSRQMQHPPTGSPSKQNEQFGSEFDVVSGVHAFSSLNHQDSNDN